MKMRLLLCAACTMLWVAVPNSAVALDPGVIANQRLNVFLELPVLAEAFPAPAARERVAAHVDAVVAGEPPYRAGLAHAYWQDYREVLRRYPEASDARPVLVKAPDGSERVARWLVGLRMGDRVGGFFALDPADGSLQSLPLYTHGDNPFAMDQPPLLMVINHNFMGRQTRRKDERRHDDPESFFQIADWDARSLSFGEIEQKIVEALHAWGPLYAQHLQRDRRGNPAGGIRAKGVHACVIVGYSEIEGRLHFIYRETFGNANHRYLEDGFLGPAYRAFPIEFFYQAIAFPHRLELAVTEFTEAPDGTLSGLLSITTNRGNTPVSAEQLTVTLDQCITDEVDLEEESPGFVRFRIPGGSQDRAEDIRFTAKKRYFTSGDGQSAFTTYLRRPGNPQSRPVASTEPTENSKRSSQ